MAVTDELLLVSPCTKIPGAGDVAVVPRPLPSIETVHAAVKVADDTGRDTLGTMVLLTLSTGMRPGEVGGLRWDNVDRDAGVVHVVEQTIQRSTKLGPLKTKRSRRSVPVPPMMVQWLREHRMKRPGDEGDVMCRTTTGLL